MTSQTACSLFDAGVQIDTSTGELKDTVQLVFDINGAGNSGIGMPAFDQYRGDAYFWFVCVSRALGPLPRGAERERVRSLLVQGHRQHGFRCRFGYHGGPELDNALRTVYHFVP